MSLKQTFYKVRSSKIVQGILIANIFAFLIIGMQSSLLPKDVGVLVFSEFVIIPLLMGIIMAWCWKDTNMRGTQITACSILGSLMAILLSFIFLGEGIICLLIVSLLFLVLLSQAPLLEGQCLKRAIKVEYKHC